MRFSDAKECRLREWKSEILAEDASLKIIGRWPRTTPRFRIEEELKANGYRVVSKLSAVLSSNVAVTKLPPGEASATPLRILRQQMEEAAARGESRIPLSAEARLAAEEDAAMYAAEARMEAFADARHGGASISDALDEANEAWSRTRRRRF